MANPAPASGSSEPTAWRNPPKCVSLRSLAENASDNHGGLAAQARALDVSIASHDDGSAARAAVVVERRSLNPIESDVEGQNRTPYKDQRDTVVGLHPS